MRSSQSSSDTILHSIFTHCYATSSSIPAYPLPITHNILLFLLLTNVKLLSNIILHPIFNRLFYVITSSLLYLPLPYLLMLSSSSLHNILCCRLFIRLFYVILSSILFTLYNILPLPVVDQRQTSLQYYFTSNLQQTILCHHLFYPLLTIYRTLPLPVVLFSSKYYFMSPSLHNLILCRHLLPYSTYHLPYLFLLSSSSSQYFMLSSSSQYYFMSSPLPSLLTTYSILPYLLMLSSSSLHKNVLCCHHLPQQII
jgi:hypothetical protein